MCYGWVGSGPVKLLIYFCYACVEVEDVIIKLVVAMSLLVVIGSHGD